MCCVTGATRDATSTASGRPASQRGSISGRRRRCSGQRVVEGDEVEQSAFGGGGQAGPVPATRHWLGVRRVPPRLGMPAVAVERDAEVQMLGHDSALYERDRKDVALGGQRFGQARCIRTTGTAPRPRAGGRPSSGRHAGSRGRRSRSSSSTSSALACPRRRCRLSVQIRLSSAVSASNRQNAPPVTGCPSSSPINRPPPGGGELRGRIDCAANSTRPPRRRRTGWRTRPPAQPAAVRPADHPGRPLRSGARPLLAPDIT